jgi:CHAT domain
MIEKIRILFLSANPWTTSRILVDEEAREIFEKLQEGPYREQFEVVKHEAIRPSDLQRLLLMHKPHIVHFSGHGSKTRKIILEGASGRGKQVDPQGLVDVFRLYSDHVRLVFFNACFTKPQACALTEVIDYSIGMSEMIGDRAGVMFAGAFYRALGFGKPIQEAFESAKAELRLTKTPRARGIELFVRNGVNCAPFPTVGTDSLGENGDALRVALKQLFAGDSREDYMRRVKRVMLDEGLMREQSDERNEVATMFDSIRVSGFEPALRAESGSLSSRQTQDQLSPQTPAVGRSLPALILVGRKASQADLKTLLQMKNSGNDGVGQTNSAAGPGSAKPRSCMYLAVILTI